MRDGWRAFRAWRDMRRLPHGERSLVVYSEGAAGWAHLAPVVEAWCAADGPPLVYLSSSADDPGLRCEGPRARTFLIGDGFVRTLALNTLEAEVLLTTTPDLQTFHIKRSAATRRHVYLHHSLVSTHMIYRPAAFDHFDVVFCAGPHHETEIRARERLLGLPPKELVAHGYGRLDRLMALPAASDAQEPMVLVAPSWGPQGLLEAWFEPLAAALDAVPWPVWIRPHPRSLQLAPGLRGRLQAWAAARPGRVLDLAPAAHEALRRASVMVSDWSGAAFEYALAWGRPVLFVDTPCKVNNPQHAALGLTPVEVSAREQLGAILPIDGWARLADHLADLVARPALTPAALDRLRAAHVHHPGRSAEVAVDWLREALRRR